MGSRKAPKAQIPTEISEHLLRIDTAAIHRRSPSIVHPRDVGVWPCKGLRSCQVGYTIRLLLVSDAVASELGVSEANLRHLLFARNGLPERFLLKL